jgi:predicted transcriptional regulator
MEIERKNEPKQFISLDNLLEMLGNPTRRIILSKLAKVPHSASELNKILGISRQAVHSQLDILSSNNVVERIGDEKRGGKYRIKSNLSIRIDITPDYYSIKYSMAQVDDDEKAMDLKDIGCSIKFENIKTPNKKIRFLGQQIRDIENSIRDLEVERSKLLQNKECFIVELKNVINQTYQKNFLKPRSEVENLEREIFYTLFYNPVQFRKRINIDNLIDKLFFSDLDPFTRESKVTNVKTLLKDMSSFMDFLWEDDDDWFFDF